MKVRGIVFGAALSLSMIGAAWAQTPPAAPAPGVTPPAATAPAVKAPKAAKGAQQPRTAESIACSQKADEAGLKGKAKNKERRAFRKKCVADMMKAAAPAAPAAPKASAAPAAPAAPAKKN